MTFKIPGSELFTEKKQKIGNFTFNYAQAGQGPILVLMPGLANSWHSLILIAQQLQKDYKVIILEPPGFGKSDRLQKYTLEVVTSLMAKFIQDLQVKPYAIIGLSMSSLIVANLALYYPEIAQKAIHISPILHLNKKFFTKTVIYAVLHGGNFIPYGDYVIKKIVSNRFATHFVGKNNNFHNFTPKIKRLTDLYTPLGKKQMDSKAYIQMALICLQTEAYQLYVQSKIESHILYGEAEQFMQMDKIVDLERENSYYSSDVLLATGHSLQIENPNETTKKIKLFLNKY